MAKDYVFEEVTFKNEEPAMQIPGAGALRCDRTASTKYWSRNQFFSSIIKEASVVQLVNESMVWNEAREVDRDPTTNTLWTMVRTLKDFELD